MAVAVAAVAVAQRSHHLLDHLVVDTGLAVLHDTVQDVPGWVGWRVGAFVVR